METTGEHTMTPAPTPRVIAEIRKPSNALIRVLLTGDPRRPLVSIALGSIRTNGEHYTLPGREVPIRADELDRVIDALRQAKLIIANEAM
jgi:hypothetical protein